MKVIYIYHSCFVVELEKCVIVFDYFKGSLPVFKRDKPVYFFVSHKHQDHFSMDIFGRSDAACDVTYVLANDIRLNARYLEQFGYGEQVLKQIVHVGKNTETKIGEDLYIKTLKSTDEGVAFLIETEGVCLYHAGDLNWWHWEGESKEFNLYQEKTYHEQLQKISGKTIDLAFVPLDYRLGEAAEWGIIKFLEMTDAKAVFPMHLWERYDLIDDRLKYGRLSKYKERIMRVNKVNESWIL